MSAKEFFSGFKKGFLNFGHNIGLIVNAILLSFVYIVGVGLTAIAARLVGKKFFETKLEKDSETYWNELNIKKRETEKYYKQF